MKNFFLLFIVFCLYPLMASAEVIINEEVLAQLVEKNDLVLAGQSHVEGYGRYKGSLGRSFLPSASIVAAQERFEYARESYKNEPYYGVEVQMNLYNGGRDRVKNDLAKTEFQQEESKLKVLKFQQLEEARKTLWRALYLNEVISQYTKAQELIERNKNAANKRIRGGVATPSDKFEFEIKKSELDQEINLAELQLEKEVGRLKILLGIESHEPIRLAEKFSHDHDWRQYTDHSEKEHDYLLKPQEFEVEKSDLKASLGAKDWLPQLNAYAWWQQNNRRQDFDRIDRGDRELTNFGLQLKWNFSDFIAGNVKKNAERDFAKANELKLSYQKRELENELHLELEELKTLDEMVHVAEKNIDRTESFFKLINQEYKRGVKTSGDMLVATEKLIESRLRKMKLIRDFHIARAHIMAKLGK